MDVETFTSLFDEYPSYICSNENTVYKNYCEVTEFPLYVKSSNHLTTIQKHESEQVDWKNPTKAKAKKVTMTQQHL